MTNVVKCDKSDIVLHDFSYMIMCENIFIVKMKYLFAII